MRLAFGILMFSTLGTMGSGIWLIAEGLDRFNNTLAALGVLLLVMGVLSSGLGAWKIAGAGFEISRQPPALMEEARQQAVDATLESSSARTHRRREEKADQDDERLRRRAEQRDQDERDRQHQALGPP